MFRWITEQFSREYHVVCNGTTNRPSEKRRALFLKIDFITRDPHMTQTRITVRKKVIVLYERVAFYTRKSS